LLADEQDRKNIEKHLSKVRAPFLYLDYMDYGHYNIDDVKTAKEAAGGGIKAKWLMFEKRMSKGLDEIADNMGIRPAPWYKWHMFFMTIWFFLTMLSLLKRPDFWDLTFCGVLVYAAIMRHNINKKAYRMAVVGTILSIAFDLTYLIIFSEFYWYKASGWDLELAVRRFVIIINYIKLVWKIIYWPLLWKVCIDFEETVRYKTSITYKNKKNKEDREKRNIKNEFYGNYAESDLGDEDDRHIYE
jgi:hypothetical protein